MILDTSALFAIFGDEPERRSFNEAIEAAENRRMSVATYVEISIVLEARHGAEGSRELDLFLDRAAIELVPVALEQARLPRRAWHRFRRGRDPAALNFGDCLAYAVARVAQRPLLAKGQDFPQTDLELA